MISPTQRTLAKLRKEGYTAGVVEKWNAHVGVRQDFCGGIDVIAFRGPLGRTQIIPALYSPALYSSVELHVSSESAPGRAVGGQILGIQVCAASGLAAHRTKLLNEPRMREWVAAGARLVLHSWALRGARGKRKLWTCVEEEVRLEDFPVA